MIFRNDFFFACCSFCIDYNRPSQNLKYPCFRTTIPSKYFVSKKNSPISIMRAEPKFSCFSFHVVGISARSGPSLLAMWEGISLSTMTTRLQQSSPKKRTVRVSYLYCQTAEDKRLSLKEQSLSDPNTTFVEKCHGNTDQVVVRRNRAWGLFCLVSCYQV